LHRPFDARDTAWPPARNAPALRSRRARLRSACEACHAAGV